MSRFVAVLIAVLLASPPTLRGQSAAPAGTLAAGSRVRLSRLGAKPRVGIVVEQTADTLRVRWPEFSNSVAVPLADVSRLDVSAGRHRRVLRGMALGTLSVGALGAAVGAFAYQPCTSTEAFGCLLAPTNRSEAVAVGGVLGGTLGLVVGSLVGLQSHESWKEVPLDSRRVAISLRPRADGAGVAVTVPF